MQESRRLVIVRHAKADSQGSSDRERPLAARGSRDAAAGGAWLAASGVHPDHVLVSSARRALETYDALREGAGWDTPVEASDTLYSAEPETALDVVRQVPTEASTVVVVGHNPTMGTLAQLLDDGEGDAQATGALLAGGFPTCAMAVFDVAVPWADLGFTGATLTAFHVGRG
ncbi:SixA phosphatase family protein [Nocardioides sp.]|uniref:SixA phosphatase family protein n=1 Tax=Nocardioides sp. TaxID=35761 RepID=UPI002ED59693